MLWDDHRCNFITVFTISQRPPCTTKNQISLFRLRYWGLSIIVFSVTVCCLQTPTYRHLTAADRGVALWVWLWVWLEDWRRRRFKEYSDRVWVTKSFILHLYLSGYSDHLANSCWLHTLWIDRCHTRMTMRFRGIVISKGLGVHSHLWMMFSAFAALLAPSNP